MMESTYGCPPFGIVALRRLLINGVSLQKITELLRSESVPFGKVDIRVVNEIKKRVKAS